MANEMLFEVDASKIVAKLHFAGLQACRHNLKDAFVVNTGIVDDNAKGIPDDPGKTTFNLKNSSGQYQVGLVKTIEYKKSFGLEKAIDAIEKLIAEVLSSKIDDKQISDKEKAQKTEELDASKKRVATLLGIDENDKMLAELKDADGIKVLKDAAKKHMQKEAEDYEKGIMTQKENAMNQVLLPYMQAFAGAQNVKMSASSIGTIQISESVKDSSSKGLVSSTFEIEPMQEAEQKKLEASFRQNLAKSLDKPNCKHKMCFYVKYTLNVDK